MLSEKMIKALNEQIAMEGYASFLYLSKAGWFENKSMLGCAAFMYRQSQEEHIHMMKIFHYLIEMDAGASGDQPRPRRDVSPDGILVVTPVSR